VTGSCWGIFTSVLIIASPTSFVKCLIFFSLLVK
jgi:hypothetical protein